MAQVSSLHKNVCVNFLGSKKKEKEIDFTTNMNFSQLVLLTWTYKKQIK